MFGTHFPIHKHSNDIIVDYTVILTQQLSLFPPQLKSGSFMKVKGEGNPKIKKI